MGYTSCETEKPVRIVFIFHFGFMVKDGFIRVHFTGLLGNGHKLFGCAWEPYDSDESPREGHLLNIAVPVFLFCMCVFFKAHYECCVSLDFEKGKCFLEGNSLHFTEI